MNGEVDGLMLNVTERGVLQITDHVRWNTIDAADFLHLKFSRFEKLCLVVGHADSGERHTLFEDGDSVGIAAPAICFHPAFPEGLGILYCVGMGQDAGRCSAISEKLPAEFLSGYGQPDRVSLHSDGGISHDAVEPQTRDVKHIFRAEFYLLAVGGRIGIGELPLVIPVHFHPIRQKGIQPHDVSAAGPKNLAVGIAPQKQVGEHGFPPDAAGHFRIGFVMQDAVERVIQCFLTSVFILLEDGERERGDCFRDHAHAGVHSGHLNGRAGVDALSGTGHTKGKCRGSTDRVFRLIPGAKQGEKGVFHYVPPCDDWQMQLDNDLLIW